MKGSKGKIIGIAVSVLITAGLIFGGIWLAGEKQAVSISLEDYMEEGIYCATQAAVQAQEARETLIAQREAEAAAQAEAAEKAQQEAEAAERVRQEAEAAAQAEKAAQKEAAEKARQEAEAAAQAEKAAQKEAAEKARQEAEAKAQEEAGRKEQEAQTGAASQEENQSQQAQQPVSQPQAANISGYVDEVIRLVNIERGNAGLPPLSKNGTLCQAAAARASEITTLFAHTRPSGADCVTILEEYGISYTGFGENIAAGQETPEAVVTAWMNSPGHRANILDNGFEEIGVGVVKVDNSPYRYFWVQLFRRVNW